MNVELLRKIAQVIQERPTEFSMDAFQRTGPCGTTYCIGGWAAVLSGRREEETDVQEMSRLLGISDEQGDRLFGCQPPANWVDEDWYEKFGGFDATPATAAARIEHFIATEGRE